MAAWKGYLMVVKTLLTYGAKPDCVDLVSVLILILTSTLVYMHTTNLCHTVLLTVNERLIILLS